MRFWDRWRKGRPTKFQEGNRLLVSRSYEAAIEAYVDHAADHPAEAAKCYFKAGEAARRSNVLAQPRDVAPGVKLVVQAGHARAEAYYRQALGIDPEYFPALARLAWVLPDGHPERSALLHRAAAIRDDLSVLNALGEHYLRDDPEKAIEFFGRARSHSPLDGTAYEGLASACQALGRPGEAERWREHWREVYARKPRVDGRRDA
jgi:tetratricopeptide (TPR) repeat protein